MHGRSGVTAPGRRAAAGRSRPALRPDRAARARVRGAPGRAAGRVQALSDPAGLARRHARQGALPRVLPVRRRRGRLDARCWSRPRSLGAAAECMQQARLHATSSCASITAALLRALIEHAGIDAGARDRRDHRHRQARQDRRRRRRARARGARHRERGARAAARGCSATAADLARVRERLRGTPRASARVARAAAGARALRS